jgi:uncharacterized protein (DUF2249 family)
MNAVVISTTPADADALEAVRAHHAELAGALATKVSALLGAVRAAHDPAPPAVELVRWCDTDLLPHARAEEAAMYGAGLALPRMRALVEAMVAEHRVLTDLVNTLRRGSDVVEAIGAAAALQVVFDSHLEKENERLLPALAEAPEVSLAALLEGMHEALTEAGHEGEAPAETGHSCTCGEHDPAGDPELDARVVPHAIRHATIFGALDAVRPGAGLVLIAPHDPLPLLAQIEQREPGAFEVSYLERGPEAWRLRFFRRA